MELRRICSERETTAWFPSQSSPIRQKELVPLGEILHLPQHTPSSKRKHPHSLYKTTARARFRNDLARSQISFLVAFNSRSGPKASMVMEAAAEAHWIA